MINNMSASWTAHQGPKRKLRECPVCHKLFSSTGYAAHVRACQKNYTRKVSPP